MPENIAGGDFFKVEQVHFASQFAVVAFFGFLQSGQVSVQSLFVRPSRAVNALQLFAVGIAAPIRARDFHQFERFADFARGRQVRSAAQVDKVPLPVKADCFARGQIFNQFDFVFFAFVFEKFDGVFAFLFDADDLFVAVDDFRHTLFNRFQIRQSKRRGAREVVIKAVFDGGTDGDLRFGIQFLNRLRHNV